MYYKNTAGHSGQKAAGGNLFAQMRYRSYCLQIMMLVLLACLVAVYFLLGSLADPHSKSDGTDEPDALDKYLSQQIQFLGAGGQKNNMMDPTAREKDTMTKLTNQMTYTSDLKCRLSKERVNEHSCQQEIKDTTAYQDVLGMQVYTKITQCGSGSKSNGRPWLLFLHAQHYHTRMWVEINMLRLAAKLGYNNLAIDLPGFGASNASKLSPTVTREQFLDEVLKQMGIGDEKFVLVSPSMSGEYSIPYIKAKAKVADSKMVGFVAAAPAAVDQLKDFDTSTIKVRTLVIYGERDDNLGAKSVEALSKLPNATVFKVPNAGHPSYLDNSEVFMREMFKFLLCDITPQPPK